MTDEEIFLHYLALALHKSVEEVEDLPAHEIESWIIFHNTVCPISPDNWLQNALLRQTIANSQGIRCQLNDLLPAQLHHEQTEAEQLAVFEGAILSQNVRQ